MTTSTTAPVQSDFILTEREFEDSDVAVLQAEVRDMEEFDAAHEVYLLEQAQRFLPPRY